MTLYAISDLHLTHRHNRESLPGLRAYRSDWLILAGDVGEDADHLRTALDLLTDRFARVIWTPGNHDLWSRPARNGGPRGEEKYRALVEICRERGVVTPEDPYVEWPGARGTFIVPMFL